MAAHLIVDDTEPFLRVTLNRPLHGNVVTPRMMLDLPKDARRSQGRATRRWCCVAQVPTSASAASPSRSPGVGRTPRSTRTPR